MKWLLLTSFLFMLGTALAQEKDPHYQASYNQNNTSDGHALKRVGLSYSTQKREMSYPYLSEKESGRDLGATVDSFQGLTSNSDKYSGQRWSLLFGKKKSLKKYRRVRLGSHSLERAGIAKSTFFGELLVQRRYGKDEIHFSEFKIEHDYIYKNLSLPAGADSFLTATQYKLQSAHRVSSLWRLGSELYYWDYSDEHSMNGGRTKLLYALSPAWPWLWLGGQMEYLSHSADRKDYWTPTNFFSYGFKFEGAFPIYKGLMGVSELGISKVKEGANSEGDGLTGFVGIQYGNREDWNIKLQYMTISSRQSGNPWSQNSFFVFIGN